MGAGAVIRALSFALLSAECDVSQDVPPVLPTSKYYLFNVLRGGVFVLVAVAKEVPALLVTEFVHRIIDVLELYLGTVSERSLTAHFTTVYQVLEEMMDSGIPLMSEPNALIDVVRPPKGIGQFVAEMFTGRTSSVAESLSSSATSVIPWRRANVAYTSNEIYFDLVEEIDCIIEPNGTVAANSVRGTVWCKCQMSGIPDLTLWFNNPGAITDPGFHPCVRLARYEKDRLVSFVPPDGPFKLMTYSAASRDHISPIYVRPTLHWRDSAARLSIVLATKPIAAAGALLRSTVASAGGVGVSMGSSTGGMAAAAGSSGEDGAIVESVSLQIQFPPAIISVDLVPSKGAIAYDSSTNRFSWTLGTIPASSAPYELTGNIHIAPGTLPPLEPMDATLNFSMQNGSATGLAVRELRLVNDSFRYTKASRSILATGRFHIRI
jgi:AP-3 complex subunit mu